MTPTTSSESVRLALLREVLVETQRQPSSPVIAGVEAGDDAAVLDLGSTAVTLSSDFVRGSGFYLFQLGELSYFDVGYYLVVANLSDAAAMGASPIAVTTILRYNPQLTDEDFVAAIRGMKAAADLYKVEIVGGDIGGYACDVFAATVLGKAGPRLLHRSGARVGDLLCVTGVIGRAITALTYFKKAKGNGFALSGEEETHLLESWRRPRARVREGQILARAEGVTSCQDVSDGLKATVEQIAAASGVSFVVQRSAIPIDSLTDRLATFLGMDAMALASSASVDFELLFTVSPDHVDHVKAAFARESSEFSVIGTAVAKTETSLVGEGGRISQMPGVAWEQQTGDYLADIIKSGRKP